ncbi:dockerin type I domain-containing protein [Allorhodopirellula solitaria]|uniref:Dockerin type I repeat protein n=1 Tax=Allorhodopirellula solitaria TaxID=2527987 RepID=A0A5C5XXY0_9BACT|nr:dockerin type I domain-containing protein [Allorhodopirellula solitaria]TWT67409.1 Dockerin type I repeat protein [Allorhodopirellula solitaria]
MKVFSCVLTLLVCCGSAFGDGIDCGPGHGYDADGDYFFNVQDDVNAVFAKIGTSDPQADVNGDGTVTALDALLIINAANRNLFQRDGNRFDCNGDGYVSGLDALHVYNLISLYTNGGYPPPTDFLVFEKCSDSYVDVDGDEVLTYSDYLAVINELNRLESLRN